ncbi:DUF262 domain-containing protein [Alloscardovia omnicolens]|uniref:DUF262 domain-containing protein n=1 Tax=Alloscardovia omnicolens TaxID=419015 RepID=UPI003A643C6D
MAEIKSVEDLLKMSLVIPDYQRPYKWGIQNVQDLISDISHSIAESDRYHKGFTYRIGTVILHKNKNENNEIVYEIVDGQQRIITLTLLKLCIDDNFSCTLLKKKFDNKDTQRNILRNYTFLRDWFSLNNSAKNEFKKAFSSILEVTVICVEKMSEAFQLFDSQNTRGKELDPHDLLKAYHLREMKDSPYEMQHAVKKWEAKKTEDIRELFDFYLFPIWNWSYGFKSKTFTVKEIDTYKGITENTGYSYAKRVGKAMPCFQITEPFIAGEDFFEMVDHYLILLEDIKKEINDENNKKFAKINEVFDNKSFNKAGGFRYAKNLFYCALLCYYDRFHNFDEMAVKKLFIWAMMLRVDMKSLSFASVNCYAIGDPNKEYTNKIAIFQKIKLARTHNEISSLQIVLRRRNDGNWSELHHSLESIVSGEEVTNE